MGRIIIAIIIMSTFQTFLIQATSLLNPDDLSNLSSIKIGILQNAYKHIQIIACPTFAGIEKKRLDIYILGLSEAFRNAE